MMLLTFDIGNTNIVIALFDEDRLIRRWRLSTLRNTTSDEMRLSTSTVLTEVGVQLGDIEGIAVASVVPSLNRPLRVGLGPWIQGPLRFLDADSSPIALEVDEPRSVGADRIANCIAGFEKHGGPLLILDFGTAVTFDLVSDTGAFLGGAIAPEMRATAHALVQGAAQLYAVELEAPESVVGKTTADNIRAGVVLGFFELVEGLIRRFRSEIDPNLPVVATGGRGETFYQRIEAIGHYDPDLTSDGLRLWWRHSQGADR